MNTTATPELEALVNAMDEHRPACRGDERFTLDREHVTDAMSVDLSAICATCPLVDVCAAYAAAERPTGGYWAGRYWAGRKQK